MPYYRASDPTEPAPQLLSCRIGAALLRPRLEAVTDERFPGRTGGLRSGDQHRHDVLHCVVYTEGRGACRVDGRLLACRPGDCVLVDPGVPHQFGAVSADPCTYRAITLSLIDDEDRPASAGWAAWLGALAGRRLQPLAAPLHLRAADFQRYLERQRSLIDLLCQAGGIDWYAAQRCLHDILVLLAERGFEADRPAAVDDAMQRCRMLIEQRYQQALPVALLARETGCSEGRFHRRFKQAYGVSPTALQLQLRIRAAQTLLEASSLPCKAIADRIGFADSAAFSKAFKKQVGLSPQQWRERKI